MKDMGKFTALLFVFVAFTGITLAKPEESNSLGKLLSEAVRKVKQAKHATDKEETHDALRDGNEHYFVDIQQRKEAQLLRKLDNMLAERWITHDLNNKGTSPSTGKPVTVPPTTVPVTTNNQATAMATTQAPTNDDGTPQNDFWKLFFNLWKFRNLFNNK